MPVGSPRRLLYRALRRSISRLFIDFVSVVLVIVFITMAFFKSTGLLASDLMIDHLGNLFYSNLLWLLYQWHWNRLELFIVWRVLACLVNNGISDMPHFAFMRKPDLIDIGRYVSYQEAYLGPWIHLVRSYLVVNAAVGQASIQSNIC